MATTKGRRFRGVSMNLNVKTTQNELMTREDQKKLFEEIEAHKEEIFVVQHVLEAMVPQHTHSQGHILVVLEGVATLNIGRHAYYIPNGYFVWIPPEMPHRISFDCRMIRVMNIYFPLTFGKDEFYDQMGVYPIPSILYHVFELMKTKNVGFEEGDWQYELLATAHHILPHLVDTKGRQLRLPTSDHPVVVRIVEAIQRSYQNALTAQEIAEEVGLSVRTMSRYLRSELDVSFVQYVRTYRIVMAIQQMVKGEESITNIAYNVGYESLTAFSNAFFKVTGYRPSQFLSGEHVAL